MDSDWGNIWILLTVWIAMAGVGRPLLGRWLRPVLNRMEGQSDRSKREREQRVNTIIHVVLTTMMVGLTACLLFVGMSELGFNIGPLIAGAGVIGFAMGFGSQNLVRDVINGLFILIEDQFGQGDIVEIAGVKGKVVEFSLRRTVLRDDEGVAHYIPNSQIAKVANMTQEWAFVVINVKVGMEEEIEKVHKLLLKTAQEISNKEAFKKVVKGEPQVTLEEVGGGMMIFKIRLEVEGGAQWWVRRTLWQRLKTAAEKGKVELK